MEKYEKITLAAMMMRSCRAELVVNIHEYFFTKNGRVHTQTYTHIHVLDIIFT